MSLEIKKKDFLNRLEAAKKSNLYFYMMKVSSVFNNGRAIIGGKECINFTSNDYLGLANHPKMKESAIEAIKKYGVATGQTRLFGSLPIHEELENKLADFIGTESALVFSSGYAANLGTISGLIEEGDCIISDERNHASIIDGCRISKGKIIIYKHNDMKELEDKIASLDKGKKKLIVVESVFSMDGDLANVPEICKLKEKYKVLFMIDDAHGTGTIGKRGRGVVEHFGVEGRVDIVMGSFGKSFGSMGGFIGANKDMIEFLKHNARSFVFTTSLPPSLVYPVISAIELINNNPNLVHTLQDNSKFMREELRNIGFNIGNTETQIIPITIGNELKMFQLVKELFNAGIAVNPVVFPAVPQNEAKIRICITSIHMKQDLERTLEVLKIIGKKFDLIR